MHVALLLRIHEDADKLRGPGAAPKKESNGNSPTAGRLVHLMRFAAGPAAHVEDCRPGFFLRVSLYLPPKDTRIRP